MNEPSLLCFLSLYQMCAMCQTVDHNLVVVVEKDGSGLLH